jgi:hypothetical protein
MKIGRNDPCPCGSGIKYKKCHLDREMQPEVSEGELRGRASKHKIPKKCFHSSVDSNGCSGKVIEAHTVSKSGSLRTISRNGKVYHFKPDLNSLFENSGKFVIKEIGIGQASTFPGFCAFHDRVLFSPIENDAFEVSELNCTLLGYRALTREIYAKEMQKSGISFKRDLDKGKPVEMQAFLQNYLHHYEKGIDLGLRDLYRIKERYDQAFKENDYSSVKYFVISFSELPHILFSGSVYPEYDFSGNKLQTFNTDKALDGIAINIVATQTGGAVVFQWFGESSVNKQLITSLSDLPDCVLANAVTQFAFETFENLFISPEWWDTLTSSQKAGLERRVLCGSGPVIHSPKCFIPDGNSYATWIKPIRSQHA